MCGASKGHTQCDIKGRVESKSVAVEKDNTVYVFPEEEMQKVTSLEEYLKITFPDTV